MTKNSSLDQKNSDQMQQHRNNLKKYQTLAYEAKSTGDIILQEVYSQYAEHYQRIINSTMSRLNNKQKKAAAQVESASVVSSPADSAKG